MVELLPYFSSEDVATAPIISVNIISVNKNIEKLEKQPSGMFYNNV